MKSDVTEINKQTLVDAKTGDVQPHVKKKKK